MGCASSNPLVEGGKSLMDNAKQATDNVIEMGEKAMHDAGDAMNNGIETVKCVVESAQNSIGAAMTNIENSMGIAKNGVEAAIDPVVEDASTAVEETVSDGKTVLLALDEDISSTSLERDIKQLEDMEVQAEAKKQLSALKDEFGETVEQLRNDVEETLHEDNATASAATTASATADNVDEEAPLTAWEAAADEILRRSFSFNLQAESLPPDFDDDYDVDNTCCDNMESTLARLSTSTTSTMPTTTTTTSSMEHAAISSDAIDSITPSSHTTDNSNSFGGDNHTTELPLSDTTV